MYGTECNDRYGNIVGVATAVCAGGPGALFWMIVAAFFGMATKFSEGLLAIKYRVVDKDGHSLGGPFYYIEQGMGPKWKWLAKIFAFFGVCVGLFGIGTFSQVNGIASAIQNFFDPNKVHTVAISGNWNLFLDGCSRFPDPCILCGCRADWRNQAYSKCQPDCCSVYGSCIFCICIDFNYL